LGLEGNQEPLVRGRQEKQRKSWGALGRSSLKVGPSFGNQQTFASSLLLHFQRKGVAIKQRVARFVLVPQPPQPSERAGFTGSPANSQLTPLLGLEAT
jgi:hypothetical protein